MGRALAASIVIVLAASACSDDGPSAEPSAAAFCARWEENKDTIEATGSLPSGGESRPDLLQELADLSPDEDLTTALEEMADLQPEWRRQVDLIESGPEHADEIDNDLLVRFGAYARAVVDGVHRVCD